MAARTWIPGPSPGMTWSSGRREWRGLMDSVEEFLLGPGSALRVAQLVGETVASACPGPATPKAERRAGIQGKIRRRRPESMTPPEGAR